MKLLIVALAFVALVAAGPVAEIKEPVKILRSEFNQQPEGGYVFSYETDDGSQRSETGDLKETLDEENKPHQVVVVRGSFSYVNSEGKVETINYYADETGFHAEGDSIPKSPVARR
ncbi:larval cuticle protein 1-like [Zerene cesonia]|uniref:larval cuticle protein 1-like n=1 Tax=Zerene cesonia TaxID=33412 RepID=UPI0018E556E9|nr:larval cuticle protein 1-like [Zerene cesonia]